MSRPERFDLAAAEPLAPARPLPCPRRREPEPPGACEACADELRCPFRALARLWDG